MDINVTKTKIVIFGKGRPKLREPFFLNGERIEETKKFKYLGLNFTVGLSFSEHVMEQSSKAEGSIGFCLAS